MVKKLTRRKKQSSHITLHPHHAKPYRKRHIGLLFVLIALFTVLAILLIQYREQVIAGVTSSRNFVMDLVGGNTTYETTLQSTYGFSLTFDSNKFYINAVDGMTGKVYQNAELTKKLPYTTVQLAPYTVPYISDQSAFSLNYHPEIKKVLTVDEFQMQALKDAGIKAENVQLVKTDSAIIGGKTFEQTVWQTKQQTGAIKSLRTSFSLYTAMIDGHPLTITISEGFVNTPGTHAQYDELLQALRFDDDVAQAGTKATVATMYRASTPSLLDTITMSHIAAAAIEQSGTDAAGKIAALDGPAVAKVFNLYCADIAYDDQVMFRNACSGSTGSAFFVSQDGYLATNGHVASMDTRDIAIYQSYLAYITNGDTVPLKFLTSKIQVEDSEIEGISQKEAQGVLIDKMYSLDASHFKKTNDVQNLFVELSDKSPDLDKMMQDTMSRKKFMPDATLVPAEVKAFDYRSVDGSFNGFHSSDVAILKVSGKNFPIVRIGGFDDVTQGDNISILGFPEQASDNGVVDSKTTVATLTTGKVSAKKKAEGNGKMLIETDTTIGHGNSGGPVFADNGSAIGIATYTIDGSGSGNGTYNYIRDIKDLTDLAAAKSISFDTNSVTQAQWEQGMQYFYTAHYSMALPYFDKVKELYPNHSKVTEFTATAKKRIADGLDVQDLPVLVIVAAAVVLFAGAGSVVVIIVRHNKKHRIYVAGVAQGSVAPMTPGVSSQTVSIASAPVVTAHSHEHHAKSDPSVQSSTHK